ncbi:MAG TPA: nucleotide exchange factor GrpE [Anaerolineales bacterium]|nr:nucleotide exchange factor GrpE [Anaerolineales bacterium]
MTEKKHHKKEHKHEEEAMEIPVEAVAEVSGQVSHKGMLSAEVEALKKQVEETEAKVSEYKDSWMRSQAEFQNYKKRIERDHEMTRVNMKSDIVKKILPLLDDLERALQNRPADESWANGIELIVRKFQSALDGEGVKRIEAEGAEFDPNFHEAISHEPNEEVESGYVIAVVQNGYMLGERVIRPALVRVAQ